LGEHLEPSKMAYFEDACKNLAVWKEISDAIFDCIGAQDRYM